MGLPLSTTSVGSTSSWLGMDADLNNGIRSPIKMGRNEAYPVKKGAKDGRWSVVSQFALVSRWGHFETTQIASALFPLFRESTPTTLTPHTSDTSAGDFNSPPVFQFCFFYPRMAQVKQVM